MELDRHYIERNDFSAARRGYDPDEVDRHLREIADSVSDLKRQQKPQATASLASAAADQVRSIVEAAERSAAEIQESAENEARRITDEANQAARDTRARADADAVERVGNAEEATTRVLERATSIEGEIDGLLGDLRSSANGLVERLNGASGSLQGELDQMRSEFASVREARLEAEGSAPATVDAVPDEEPAVTREVDEEMESEAAAIEAEETEAEAEAAGETEVEEEPSYAADNGDLEGAVVEEEEEVVAEAEPEPEPEPASSGRSIRGAEGARLIALNMALNGTPRDETARYLEQNFDLDDQEGLLDEVYARVGG